MAKKFWKVNVESLADILPMEADFILQTAIKIYPDYPSFI